MKYSQFLANLSSFGDISIIENDLGTLKNLRNFEMNFQTCPNVFDRERRELW